MAITSGTYTIGSSGDYSTYNAFVSDLGTQTGDITGTLISDSTMSANAPMVHDMANFDIYLDADNEHGGVISSAYNLTVAHDNNGINPASGTMLNEGMISVSGFRLTRTVAASNTTKALIAMFNFFQGSMHVHHMFLDGGGVNGHGIGMRCHPSLDRFAWSNLIWDCGYDGINRDSAGEDFSYAENNTVRNCGNGYLSESSESDVVNNTACFSNTTLDFDIFAGTETGDNNASTDATADDWNTATDNLINLTETDEVESTDDTSSDFMVPKSTSNIKDSGVAPEITANTTDITGKAYDGTYPIGCYLEPSSPSGSITNYYYQLLMAG